MARSEFVCLLELTIPCKFGRFSYLLFLLWSAERKGISALI